MERIRAATEEEMASLAWIRHVNKTPQETLHEDKPEMQKVWEKIFPMIKDGGVARIVLNPEEYYKAPNRLRKYVRENTTFRVSTLCVYGPSQRLMYVRLREKEDATL